MNRNFRSASDYRVIRNVTVVGSVVDALLALGKLTGGIAAQSQALIAVKLLKLNSILSTNFTALPATLSIATYPSGFVTLNPLAVLMNVSVSPLTLFSFF